MVKRRKRKTSMPASGAGLVRYMDEEGMGIKFRPEHVLYSIVGLIILEVLLKSGFI
ncbi:MAG: preprotein translocase subunit Sec61beta [Candidatus Hydrothermarchaeaceae archaeon]|jgi:preprotein translocase subunit Sec61beta